MRQMLLDHLKAASAQKHGATMHRAAVLDGQQTFYLVAEADNRSQLEEFYAPLTMASSVGVWLASHRTATVERGSCEPVQL